MRRDHRHVDPDAGAFDDDPRPEPPVRPSNDDCCKSSCDPCVFDIYDAALDRYRSELKAWHERQARRNPQASERRKPSLSVRVECYAGYRGDQEPVAFWLGQRRLAVRDVVDRWFAPDQRWFRVDADDGSLYILRHDETSGDWELAAFTSSARRVVPNTPYASRPLA